MAVLIIINTFYKYVLTLYINTHILYTFRYTLLKVMAGVFLFKDDRLVS